VATTGTIKIVAGSKTGTLVLTAVSDVTTESVAETVTVTLGAVANVKLGVVTQSTTITDTSLTPTVPVNTDPINISATLLTGTATTGVDTFNIAAGSYAATITGFGTGDTLVFDPNSAQAVTNDSGSDGIIKIAGSLNSQQVVVTLTGVSAALDNQVFNLASFTKAFAPAAVVGPSTTNSISARDTTKEAKNQMGERE